MDAHDVIPPLPVDFALQGSDSTYGSRVALRTAVDMNHIPDPVPQ